MTKFMYFGFFFTAFQKFHTWTLQNIRFVKKTVQIMFMTTINTCSHGNKKSFL